jgi:hypothetical protein
MFKKTLQVEFKNTLRDAPLVPDSVSSVLNKEEIPSVQSTVLACNLPEVDLLQHAGGQNLRVSDDVHVFVLNLRKEPLMYDLLNWARLLSFLYLDNSLALLLKKGGGVNSSHS